MQLDFHVPEAALAAMMPAGFTPNVATQGAAARANIRVIFIDRVGITGPDNRALGTGMSRMVYLAAPVKDASGANVQLIIGGVGNHAADAPGPFGNYVAASTADMTRTITAAATS